MFLFRIGKEKWAYKLTMSLYKLKYSDLSSLNHYNQFQIQVIRGNHKLKFMAGVNKKGQIVCDKKSQNIPMTLYYDKDDKTFNKKQMTIKGKIVDQLGVVQVQLGQAELDIAENAKPEETEKFIIEVQLQGGKNKICKVKFNVAIERNFDENASNFETTTNVASEKAEKQTKRSANKDLKKSVQKSIHKSKQPSLRNYGKKEQQSEQQSQTSLFSNFRVPKKGYQRTQMRQKKHQSHQKPSKKIQNQQTQKSYSPKIKDYNAASEDNDTVVLGRHSPPKKLPTPPKLNGKHSSAYSLQLKLYEAEQALKQKEKELAKTKKMLEDQQKINSSLVQEQRKEQSRKQTTKMGKQVQKLRTQLQVANMKISQIESSNRSYIDQLQKANRNAEKTTRHLENYKTLIERQKMRMAQLLQKALQTGDSELITFIEEGLQDQ